MKKFIASILVFLTLTTWVIAYNPTDNDNKILNNLYPKLDVIWNKSSAALKKLWTQIDVLREKYKNNERVYFILSQTVNYINDKYSVFPTYKVVKVTDWDTLQINYNWKDESFRLIWIDSPESYATRFWYKECFWDEASSYLKNLLDWKNVKIEFDESQWKTDKYWRYLAYIFLDWVNMNEKMIKDGYAWEYTYNKTYKYQSNFKSDQDIAKDNKVWLWSTDTCNWERLKDEEKNTSTSSNTWSIDLENILNNNNSENQNSWSFSCEVKKTTCTKMATCEEAKFYLNSCWINRLDADKDWVPCESLCN
jgi:micrococcal nuclease